MVCNTRERTNFYFNVPPSWKSPNLKILLSSCKTRFGQNLKEGFRMTKQVELCSFSAFFNLVGFRISLLLSSWPLLALLLFCWKHISHIAWGWWAFGFCFGRVFHMHPNYILLDDLFCPSWPAVAEVLKHISFEKAI